MAQRGFEVVPTQWSDLREWCRKLAEAVNLLLDGKTNATGEVTLAASTTTTTLADRRGGPNSIYTWMALSANAAAEEGNGTMFVSARGKQTATITHANSAQTDRTFGYAIVG